MKLKKVHIALVLFSIITSIVNAQFVSNNGWFEVTVSEGCPVGGCTGNEISGCVPLTITVASTASAPVDCFDGAGSCDFDYTGDGTIENTSSTITYDTPGQFMLQIIHASDGVDQIAINISPSEPPEFSIFSCSNEEIQVNISDTQFENYIIDFGDGSPEVFRTSGAPNAQHSYADNLSKTVSVRGVNDNGADNCNTAEDIVIPLAAIPPSRFDSLVSLNNGEIALYYDLQPDIQHRLEIKAGSAPYTLLKQLNASTIADTIQNLDVANTSYCFRIVSIDPCAGFNTVSANSPEICNTLLDVDFLDGVNTLSWQVGGATSSFGYTRVSSTETVNRPDLTGLSFDDTDIDCQQEYCYTLTTIYADNSTSRSLEVCGSSFNTRPPTSIIDLSVNVDGNSINLNWPETPAEPINEYSILRGTSTSSLVSLASSEINTYLDEGLNTDETRYCYQISPLDECGNRNTDGVIACSMLLSGAIAADNTVTLDWTEYEGWSQGVANYIIEKSYSNNDAPDGNSALAEFQEIDDNPAEQVIFYRIQALPLDNSLEPVYSNTLTLIKPNNIYYPNAFTPDGDGTNDTFAVNGRFIVSYDLRIFNRWGEEIFNSTSPDIAWDGTREGKPLPLGAYAFKADITDQAGREITKAGSVLLIRN
ncbi:MAG: gliding motility-associated C-terminal domain-containing protein [Bacteroidota bacterium]